MPTEFPVPFAGITERYAFPSAHLPELMKYMEQGCHNNSHAHNIAIEFDHRLGAVRNPIVVIYTTNLGVKCIERFLESLDTPPTNPV